MPDNTIGIIRIQHGVVATNDLGKSMAFYMEVLGGRFERLVNVNLRGLNREVPEMAFFTLANHHGFGLALQDQPIPPPIHPLEGPVWGFEVDERGSDGVMEFLRIKRVEFEGPVEYPSDSPVAASIFFRDPDDFVYEVCTRPEGKRNVDQGQGDLGLCCISHVRLEVTDLAEAEKWYREVLGLEDVDQIPGERQLTLAVPATGQLFVLRKVAEMTQRSLYCRGPHVDVRVPLGSLQNFVSGLTNVERYWSQFSDQIPWQEPDMETAYFYDPFGNRLQVSQYRS
jgi:catechol 2,3-dioxygenase-like lactoylglutathione lyase family enzyme